MATNYLLAGMIFQGGWGGGRNPEPGIIYRNPCPEICILKAGKFPLLNLGSSRKRISNGNSLRLTPVFFLEDTSSYAEATEGPSGVHRLRLLGGNYVEFPYTEAALPFCTNSLRGRCALKKKNAAEDRFVEVRWIQQFCGFVFPKAPLLS